jgi:signal transduction histidine kinase
MTMAAGDVAQAEELAAQHRLALLVARGASLETVFNAASEQIATLLGAAAGAVLRFLGDERAVVLSVWRRPGTRGLPVNAEVDFPTSDSSLARVRATGRPARIDSFEGSRSELSLFMRAAGMRGALAAPVLVNADARRRLVEAADESRRRLESELHEGAQQNLLALTLKLRLAHERAEESSLIAKLLGEALADAAEATASLADLGRSLHPAILGERGLAPALMALTARAAVAVQLRELPGRRFPDTTEATVYAVVADAIAGATGDVSVSVADRGDRLHVELRGCTGKGLEDAGDRVAALGGHLEIEERPAGDGVVRATIPVER